MTTRIAMAYQHLTSTNDSDGNPRRLWVVYDTEGNILEVYDEGYAGMEPVRKYRALPHLPNINIGPSEYKALKRNFPPTK